jgi:hypothetical protein
MNRYPLLVVPFMPNPKRVLASFGQTRERWGSKAMAAWDRIQTIETDTLILSGESFNITDGEALRDVIQQRWPNADIEVLCYLRDPITKLS